MIDCAETLENQICPICGDELEYMIDGDCVQYDTAFFPVVVETVFCSNADCRFRILDITTETNRSGLAVLDKRVMDVVRSIRDIKRFREQRKESDRND